MLLNSQFDLKSARIVYLVKYTTATMSSLTASNSLIAIAKGLQIDLYNTDSLSHTIINVPSKSQENDVISDVVISANCKNLALITSSSKQLLIYDLPTAESHKILVLPRSASKVRFTASDEQILVADKSGDVLIYNSKDDDPGMKLLGHLSLLLDVLQTNDGKYIISSDRDEKIRISCYPNTYNTQTYCLGHKEFVNHIELLPHNTAYLSSTSGDGHINFWNYTTGKVCYSIDTFQDIDDLKIKEDFIAAMDLDGIQVNALPIVHYAVTKLDETSSLLAVTVYSYNKFLIYKLQTDKIFSHNLIQKIEFERFPSAVSSTSTCLLTFDKMESKVSVYEIRNDNDETHVVLATQIKMFDTQNTQLSIESKEDRYEAIKVLYKRKFDNVQEYQERKRQRLEKSDKSIQ